MQQTQLTPKWGYPNKYMLTESMKLNNWKKKEAKLQINISTDYKYQKPRRKIYFSNDEIIPRRKKAYEEIWARHFIFIVIKKTLSSEI